MIKCKIINVLITRKTKLKQSPQAVEHLLQGYWKALEFFTGHAEKAYPLIAPRLGLQSTFIKMIYADLIQLDQLSHQQFYQQQLPSVIAAHHEFMILHERIETPANASVILGRND